MDEKREEEERIRERRVSRISGGDLEAELSEEEVRQCDGYIGEEGGSK